MTATSAIKSALADRYEVEREIGAGGMATVYLAHDKKHDRNVAIKILHAELAAVLGVALLTDERFVFYEESLSFATKSVSRANPRAPEGSGGRRVCPRPRCRSETRTSSPALYRLSASRPGASGRRESPGTGPR